MLWSSPDVWTSINSILSNFVKIFTRSDFSHVGVAWVIGNRVFVIEAVTSGVRIYPLSKELPFFWVPCGKEYWNNNIEEKALSFVGHKYSKVDAIKAYFNRLSIGGDDKWQCAELTLKLIKGTALDKKPIKATPADIAREMLNQGYTISKVQNVQKD